MVVFTSMWPKSSSTVRISEPPSDRWAGSHGAVFVPRAISSAARGFRQADVVDLHTAAPYLLSIEREIILYRATSMIAQSAVAPGFRECVKTGGCAAAEAQLEAAKVLPAAYLRAVFDNPGAQK